MLNLKKVEEFLLNKLSPVTTRKWLSEIKKWVVKKEAALLQKQLDAKVEHFLETSPSSELLKYVLPVQVKLIMESTKDSDEAHRTLDIVFRAVNAYAELDPIVGVQPISAPVSKVFIMKYTPPKSDAGGTLLGIGQLLPTAKLEIVSNVVEAFSKKLNVQYSIEAAQDFNNRHDLDITTELVNAVGSEISNEITTLVLHNLTELADKTSLVELSANSVEAIVGKLIQSINRDSRAIARDTLRGNSNVIVTSPDVVSLLQNSKLFESVGTTFSGDCSYSSIIHVGTLSNDIQVYSSMASSLSGKVLIGYKGKSGPVDVGYIFAPYTTVLPLGVSITPDSFHPTAKFATRYGTYENDVSNYYKLLDVSDLLKSYNTHTEILLG
ncbi:hypothetical protein Xoosp13_243 [Xanthomonas phage Xoo-sp13]|nr:hypothetical protein Xoosp13_243 [Xanthomonas phage Xoo-sp13]